MRFAVEGVDALQFLDVGEPDFGVEFFVAQDVHDFNRGVVGQEQGALGDGFLQKDVPYGLRFQFLVVGRIDGAL